MYFEGKGKVFEAKRLADGSPGAFRWAADCNQLQLSPGTDNDEDIYESYTGKNYLAKHISGNLTMGFQMTLREWVIENLAIGFWGQSATIESTDVTGEQLPPDLVKGDIVRLKGTRATTVQISDSASSSPATLTEGTDYKVNEAYGSIEFIGDLSAYTQPFTVDYTDGGGSNLALFSTDAPERWIRFEGLNRADDGSPVLVEIYRGRLQPVSQVDLISDSVSGLQISGSTLYDATQAEDPVMGGYGRIIYPSAAA